jgi:hypothetical protein
MSVRLESMDMKELISWIVKEIKNIIFIVFFVCLKVNRWHYTEKYITDLLHTILFSNHTILLSIQNASLISQIKYFTKVISFCNETPFNLVDSY